MTNPEHDPLSAHDRKGLLKKLNELLGQIFSEKMRAKIEAEKRAKKGSEYQHEKVHHEREEERKKEEERQRKEDEKRAYHKARSAQIKEVKASVARTKRADEVISKLNHFIREAEDRPHGANYLLQAFQRIQRDVETQRSLRGFVVGNPVATDVLNTLLTKGIELHGDARKLIREAQRLSHEADKASGKMAVLKPVFEAISSRVQNLIVKELDVLEKQARRKRGHGPTAAELLEQDSGIILTDEEKRRLRETVPRTGGGTDWEATKERWREDIKSVVENPREATKPVPSEIASLEIKADDQVVEKMIAPIDRVMGEVKRKASSGALSIEDLEGFYRKIREEEAGSFPQDVPPGSKAYDAALQEVNRQTEERLKVLTQMLEKRLRQEAPSVPEGIVDPKKFLEQIVLRKGRLGTLFDVNPEMKKLFLGLDDKSRKFRNQVFLRIHSAVLSDQRNSSRDNFGLYERADFTTFIDLMREGLSGFKVRQTGQELGHAWGDYYNNLSNAIRQCRDLDYWASQPAANIENFNKSLGMFQNEYIVHAIKIPAVEAAFRAYETTLRSIWHSNDGYIPPGFIEYKAPEGSFWDIYSQRMFEQMVSMGSVPDVKRDNYTRFEIIDKDGHSVMMDFDNPLKLEDLSPDEKLMYMTLAKGLGMASCRFLEIFANTKIPGSDQPGRALEGFHSTPYEGVARALNYFSTFIHKWKIGAYKYFYLFNLLVPKDKRIRLEDSTEAIKAYMAYQDGTFTEKYGEKAKRFVDLLNFSKISSALGKHTTWRQWDATIGWSDKRREFLGGPTRLILAGQIVEEKVKDLLVAGEFREKYRQEIIKKNREEGLSLPTSGGGFDKLWEEYGKEKYAAKIKKEWERLRGKHPAKGLKHTPLRHESDHLIDAYQSAFKAKVWVEMAMRNPLVVAHGLEVDMPLVGVEVGVEGKKKIRLHNLLVQDVLGIPPEDAKFTAEFGRAGYATTPSEKQKKYMIEILRLEGDLASVKEKVINKGRDLTEADFNIIGDDVRREQALKYWRKVREVILGTDDLGEAERLYKRFGLGLSDNKQDYLWDLHAIHKIDETVGDLDKKFNKRSPKGRLIGGKITTIMSQEGKPIEIPFLLKEAISMDPEWILGTDDMAFGKMDWENLGARQWLRRGGDIAAHWEGGNKVTEYLMHLKPNPDKHKLAEALVELRNAYSEDMIECGWTVGANLAYMTDRLFAWDWSLNRLGSAAQIDVWGTRRNVAAWLANGRREWWDALEHADVFPPHAHFYYYDHMLDEGYDIHELRKWCHAANPDVWKEIITLGLLLALAITLWRALTAPSEEEEGGGGGHGGGHH